MDFQQILHQLETGEEMPRPSRQEVVDMMLLHARLQLQIKGDYIGIRKSVSMQPGIRPDTKILPNCGGKSMK